MVIKLQFHWTSPLGEYSPRIAPVDTMVIDFCVKNWVVALCNCCSKASIQKAQNIPSNQLIQTTSCVEKSNITIKAKEHS